VKTNRSNREIICAECPDIYGEADIIGQRGDESKPLIDILGQDDGQGRRPAGKLFKRIFAVEQQTSTRRGVLANLDRLKDWEFRCPRGHVVDGNRGQQLPIAVVGASGASKSHFLPGLIWETGLQSALGKIGISLRAGQFTQTGLNFSVTSVYERKMVLPPTPPDKVTGPYGYRLTINRDERARRYSLLLFDVGGEALSTIVKIREQAAFVLLCQAIFVLIDPEDVLPTQFDEDGQVLNTRERVIAAGRVREGISRIADALEELWDTPVKNIPVPVCFVVAKSDSVIWDFLWDDETTKLVDGALAGEPLRELLLSSSDRVRTQLSNAGGDLIVSDILDRFDGNKTRFVAASATSEMPVPGDGQDRHWDDPTPNGISLGLLQLLDLLGRVAEPESEAQVTS
jgi:hypothetical protein